MGQGYGQGHDMPGTNSNMEFVGDGVDDVMGTGRWVWSWPRGLELTWCYSVTFYYDSIYGGLNNWLILY